MAEYITKTLERLDKICEKRYGDTEDDKVMKIIAANPHIEEYGILLPAGLKVILPNIATTPAASTPIIEQIRLWD